MIKQSLTLTVFGMTSLTTTILCVWSVAGLAAADQLRFPPGFQFGAATSAYQIEGAWNVSDKGLSIWDVYVHRPDSNIANKDTGDVACDSYNQYRRDVQMAKEIGLDFYRFSINWPRLFPTGFTNKVSEDGKRYYNGLIDELLQNGIEPLITLYHWDLPQSLQDLGGWTNPLIVKWFGDYARKIYSLFGDRVKTWITINEPFVICDLNYNTGLLAPGIFSPGIGSYMCSKHVMLAHAKAYRIYDEEFRATQNGKISLANQLFWIEGLAAEDEFDAEIARQYSIGIYSHPIYSEEGGWPPAVEKILAEKSQAEGFTQSRLPAFTPEEIEFVKGTFDFYAFNFYTARAVRKARRGEEVGPYPMFGMPDVDIVLEWRSNWLEADLSFFKIYPKGLRLLLSWLKKNYGDLEFFITENGFAGSTDQLNDDRRVRYIYEHLEQILLAIEEDAVNVIGYAAWSLMDNFEWFHGYDAKFGLYAIDFKDPRRTRIARKSAKYYEKVIKTRSLVPTKNIKTEL